MKSTIKEKLDEGKKYIIGGAVILLLLGIAGYVMSQTYISGETGNSYINTTNFHGIYDWITSSNLYLTFNGTMLYFNDTRLNMTTTNQSLYWDELDSPIDLSDGLTLDCGNITGADFDICTNPDTTISDTNCSVDMSCSTVLYDSEVINATSNKSLYWNDFNSPIDLANTTNLYCGNITGSDFDLCTNPDTNISDTNETVRVGTIVGTECTAGDFIYNFSIDGTPQCNTPAGGGDVLGVFTQGLFLMNGSDTGNIYLEFNTTYADTYYYTQTDADLAFLGITDQRFNETIEVNALDGQIQGVNASKLNITDQRYNDTVLVQAVNESAFGYVDSKLNTTYYTATHLAVITGTGAGALADIQTSDNIGYNVSEVDSDFDLRVNFTGVTGINQIVYRYKSEVDEPHIMHTEIWNYDTSTWMELAEEGSREHFGIFVYMVLYEDLHLSDGVVQLRFYTTNGPPNTVHKWEFDWVTVSDGPATPSSAESDPFSVRKDGTTPLTANWDAGSFNITANTFIGNLTGTANSSDYWDGADTPIDLNDKLTLDCGNITGADFDICTNPDTNITDTNETTRIETIVGTECTTGDFIFNFSVDGTPQCKTPAGGGDILGVYTQGLFLMNGSDTGSVYLEFNTTYADTYYYTQTDADSTFLGIADQRFNETDVVQAINTTSQAINTSTNINSLFTDDLTTDDDTHAATGGIYLYNDSSDPTIHYFNDTMMNLTIGVLLTGFDSNASNCGDGEYLDGSGLCINFNATVDDRDANTNIIDDSLYNTTSMEEQNGGILGVIDTFINALIDNRITQAFIGALGFFTKTETQMFNETIVIQAVNTTMIAINTSTNIDSLFTDLDIDDTDELLLDGTRAMTGGLDMGGYNITNLGNVSFLSGSLIYSNGSHTFWD